MGRRSGRAAAKRAAAALESTPRTFEGLDDDDETMPDADHAPSPQQEDDEDGSGNEDAQSGEEEEEAEAEEERGEEEGSAKSPTPPPEPVIRRRRLGRPPKNRPPDWDQLPLEPRDPDAPPRRGRGRGGWRGRGRGRGAKHGTPTRQIVDKDGSVLAIKDDEVELPEDPEGETKVDKMGRLQGGREYRCRTFTVQGRGERLYMLSTEPARCVGFRDSYLFFAKHKRLFKIIVDDEEKKDMIEREIIPHSYKGRAIGIVTARSVFREFGALIVVGGKRIVDDYAVAKAREEGVTEGELADPNDQYEPDKPYNKNQYVAWHGASSVYHNQGPAAPLQDVKGPAKKRKVAVNDVNWQLEHAREASNFNSSLSAFRRMNLNGVYNIHTNQMMYPATMQPTAARIQQIPNPSTTTTSDSNTTLFATLPPMVPRNFLVTDTIMETPPAGISPAAYDVPFRTSPADYQASYGGDFLAPFRGLGSVSKDVRDLLPEECRRAFDEAAGVEGDWFSRWGDEKDAKSRREPRIDKDIVPYSVPLG
ncbi:chromatin remodelling complex Rsc7/Swp82 subunit-domain-containing protein [Coniochaeta sp. 2T2.1]|nr:chromatin remodelling complex Rsc7/Swp82 subunit-domain-containing protein [Coniochaeta sp. 2T2.1]